MATVPRDAVGLPVLVVDDDAAIIRTLAEILELHGYRPQTAASGREGLRLAERTHPALAVVDLRLPDMDGLELAHKLHELSELTQVVVLTGNASVESAIAALRERSVDYLVKPVNVDHLLHVVSVAGERWQRRNAEIALRESEDRYRMLFERNPQPMWVEDRESTRILAVNEAALAHYGYARADFLALRPADLAAVPDGTRGAGEMMLLRHRRADGRTIDVEVTSNDIPFGGQPACIVLAVDVTERLAAERAMRQHQRLEAVGRLAGGVAHDFSNILTAITGYAEMLRAAMPPGNEMHDDVTEILKASDRAAALTRQLLAFSRQQNLQPRLVSLNDSVRDMENMLRRLIGEDVAMVTRLEHGIAPVLADPGQLQQVLLNLCVNARDAMPKGGTLTVSTANAPAPEGDDIARPGKEYVMLTVSDTGTGMDEETRSRVFEPFFTTKGSERGTGLGLATVYGIVTQSGGAIRVESRPGAGTTFRVYLPAAAPDAAVTSGA